MLWWAFNQQQLDRAMAEFVKNSAAHDMTDAQAIQAAALTVAFLTSKEAIDGKLIGGE